ncbi:MAG TPA: RidA family protein [Candidatus Sulfotelmatobacter sp.]|nr:RidA family protein [Candidatus Sulfotelmatobacter sp.]
MAGKREIVVPKGMEAQFDRFHYAPAVKAGGLLFVSGQVGRDESKMEVVEGAEAQIALAFANLGRVLAAAGCGFADVVELISYHTDIKAQMRPFIAEKDKHFPKDFPAWTALGVAALAHPKIQIEIRCTAALP